MSFHTPYGEYINILFKTHYVPHAGTPGELTGFQGKLAHLVCSSGESFGFFFS